MNFRIILSNFTKTLLNGRWDATESIDSFGEYEHLKNIEFLNIQYISPSTYVFINLSQPCVLIFII